jgi:hypothetical protein
MTWDFVYYSKFLYTLATLVTKVKIDWNKFDSGLEINLVPPNKYLENCKTQEIR